MHRPRISARAVRGFKLLIANYQRRILHGFIPHDWGPREREDVTVALRYMAKLSKWHDKATPIGIRDDGTVVAKTLMEVLEVDNAEK